MKYASDGGYVLQTASLQTAAKSRLFTDITVPGGNDAGNAFPSSVGPYHRNLGRRAEHS